MKKTILGLIISLIAALGFNINVGAISAPSKIQAGVSTSAGEFVTGYRATIKKTADNKNLLYCDTQGLKFPTNQTINLGREVDKGFVYILSNRPKTGNTNKDNYIMQMAVWWYKDIVDNKSTNLDASFKSYCTNNRNNHEVCGEIYKLVNKASSYKEPVGKMSFSSATVTFSQQGDYYISSMITLTANNMKTSKGIKLVGAPTGTVLINEKFYDNHNGTFQVRIPVNSVPYGSTISFKVETEGTYSTYSAYDYFYATGYQRMIYDVLYETSNRVYITKNLEIKREPKPTTTTTTTTTTQYVYSSINSLTIRKVDQKGDYLRNAEITLYYGDCLYQTCNTRPVYTSWISSDYAKIIYNLPIGFYTVVETKAPYGYETAEKGLVYVGRNDTSYYYTLVNVLETNKPVRISKTDITGTKEISGATLTVKNLYGNTIETWVSTNTPKYINLGEGTYTLEEQYAPKGYKLNTETIYFKVNKDGTVTVRNIHGNYIPADYVRMLNSTNDKVSINKLDKNTNNYISGVILEIKNEKGEVVSTWTTTNESYNIALNPGEYTVTEMYTPEGYVKNNQAVYFKVLEDGTVMLRNNTGGYDITGGIIIYNEPKEEYEIIVDVPKTGLSSTLTYIVGTLTLLGGSWMLVKNGKFN